MTKTITPEGNLHTVGNKSKSFSRSSMFPSPNIKHGGEDAPYHNQWQWSRGRSPQFVRVKFLLTSKSAAETVASASQTGRVTATGRWKGRHGVCAALSDSVKTFKILMSRCDLCWRRQRFYTGRDVFYIQSFSLGNLGGVCGQGSGFTFSLTGQTEDDQWDTLSLCLFLFLLFGHLVTGWWWLFVVLLHRSDSNSTLFFGVSVKAQTPRTITLPWDRAHARAYQRNHQVCASSRVEY